MHTRSVEAQTPTLVIKRVLMETMMQQTRVGKNVERQLIRYEYDESLMVNIEW